jgi:Poxvirus A22 protein
MLVLSIDIGVIHFAFTQFEIKDKNKDENKEENKEENKDEKICLMNVEMVDITEYTHHLISKKECKLYHTRTMSDWLEHTIQEYFSVFSQSDIILIERQPPTSPFIAIEQLLFNKYREKVELIAPRNVHSYLSISYLSYDDRKKYSEKIARRFVSSVSTEKEMMQYDKKLEGYDRCHDVADSICIFLYWRGKREKELLRIRRQKQMEMLKDMQGLNVMEKLERFRYIPLK